jgi:hypothetical protein
MDFTDTPDSWAGPPRLTEGLRPSQNLRVGVAKVAVRLRLSYASRRDGARCTVTIQHSFLILVADSQESVRPITCNCDPNGEELGRAGGSRRW